MRPRAGGFLSVPAVIRSVAHSLKILIFELEYVPDTNIFCRVSEGSTVLGKSDDAACAQESVSRRPAAGSEPGSGKTIIWKKRPVMIMTAIFCCALWGSAHSCIKIGYRLFGIGSGDVAGQIFFAGVRFFLAGVMTLLFGSIAERRLILPERGSFRAVASLASTQTVLQYVFFYIGLAHASAVRSSIINGCGTFASILMAVFVFRYEKLTRRKVIGSIMGFAGVVILETLGGSVEFGFSLNGEGFVLVAVIASALAACLIKKFSARFDPVMLSGCQFMLGGAVMAAASFAAGGRLDVPNGRSLLLILYMAFISSAAYTLWGILLKYNPVSSVSMFSFVTPAAGVIISSLLLDEQSAFNLWSLSALALICMGIIVVFTGKGEGREDERKV